MAEQNVPAGLVSAEQVAQIVQEKMDLQQAQLRRWFEGELKKRDEAAATVAQAQSAQAASLRRELVAALERQGEAAAAAAAAIARLRTTSGDPKGAYTSTTRRPSTMLKACSFSDISIGLT